MRPPLGLLHPSARQPSEILHEPRVGDRGDLHPAHLHPLARGEAGDRAEHRQAVVAVGVEHASAQGPAPVTAKPSSVASISAPRPRRPSTTVAIRSDSFRRSSCAPRTTVSPSAKHPSSATSGSSSIASGTSSGLTKVPSSPPAATSRSLTGSCAISSPVSSSRSPSTIPCIRIKIRRNPLRVQLTPTSRINRREPPTNTPAAIMNAAELGSPGTRTRSSTSSSVLVTVTERPLRWTLAPALSSIRSVWSRLRSGSVTVLAPSAASAASSTHDFTWALATGSV